MIPTGSVHASTSDSIHDALHSQMHDDQQQHDSGALAHAEHENACQQEDEQPCPASSTTGHVSQRLAAIRARRERLLHAVEHKLSAASEQLLCMLLRLCWRSAAAHKDAAHAIPPSVCPERLEGPLLLSAAVEEPDQKQCQQHQTVPMPCPCGVAACSASCSAGGQEACKPCADAVAMRGKPATVARSTDQHAVAAVHPVPKLGREAAQCCCRGTCNNSRHAMDTWVAELQESVSDLAHKLAMVQVGATHSTD